MNRLVLFIFGVSHLFIVVGCGSDSTEDDVTICQALACTADMEAGDASDPSDVGDAPDSGTDIGTTPDSGNDIDALPVLQATESHEADVLYGWVAAGQPSETRVQEVVATGATIISLRLPAEDPFDEPALVASLGGEFIRYPTNGSDYDSVAFREAMYDLYDAQLDANKIVYLHCASSNRVGASWALYQAERKGVPAEEAIAMGQVAGLTSLETRVRAVLGI